MKNEDVVRLFMGRARASGSNLYSTGDKLINYYTCLAQWNYDVLYYNMTKYSVSTSKIQNYILKHLPKNVTTIQITTAPKGVQSLFPLT